MPANKSFHTLMDAISCRCGQDPQDMAFVFLQEDGDSLEVTNAQFETDMGKYALGMACRGVGAGEIVLLAMDHSYDLLACFWGTILRGAIPSILTYFWSGMDKDVYVRKVEKLVRNFGIGAVITLPELKFCMAEILSNTGCRVFTVGDLVASDVHEKVNLPKLDAEQIALMQFTSGTTGEPKAIRFSHRAILDHVKMISETNRIPRDWVNVSWLPFYHDMGLIMHIRALVNGNIVVSMSPQIWLRMPELLFRAVSRYGNAVVNMPNFGFEYCLKRIKDEDLAGLDLSGWKILSNGSEPVKVASMERFYQKFAPYGFRRDALKVSYGMAENIAAVSMTPSGRMPRADWVSMAELYTQKKAIPVNPESLGAEAIASCGYPYPGVELAIVDQEWKRLADREVGEIIIRSDTLFDGYYLAPQDAEDSFREGWFRTGDIGYMVDGELFVCDRKKDLIIVGGRNVHPQAIENIAADIFGPFAGRCAAFGVSDQTLGTELPVLVIEQRKQVEDAEKQNLIQQVRKQVLEELDVAISDIRMVPKGWVIKTTSGKVARTANREKYLSEIKSDADEQNTIFSDELIPEQVKQNLINLFEKVLGATGIDERGNFFKLGGDSLSALRLLIEIERKFGRDIPVAQFFQQPTVGHLVEILCKGTHKETNAESDLKPWWRSKSASSHTTRARLLTLFSAGLGRIKAKAREKLTNITPAWIFERKLSKYIFSMIRVYFLRKFYKLIENPLQSKDDFLQSSLVCEVPYIIKKELKKRLNQKLSERWRPTVNMATMEESYRNGKGVIIVGWHSHIWTMALLANVVQDILKPNYYNYVGRSKRLIPKTSEELLKKDKKKIRMMIFLDQLMECKKTLAKKGVVFILPDGYAGLSHGISLPFHGRMRAFRAGFAELAVETGAAVIPVSLTMDVHTRKFMITSLNPLEAGTGEMPRAERVEGLVKQYVSFLKQEWSRSPALIPYGRMIKHIDLPKA